MPRVPELLNWHSNRAAKHFPRRSGLWETVLAGQHRPRPGALDARATNCIPRSGAARPAGPGTGPPATRGLLPERHQRQVPIPALIRFPTSSAPEQFEKNYRPTAGIISLPTQPGAVQAHGGDGALHRAGLELQPP